MAHDAAMIAQLRSLLQLTQTEIQIARVRVAQARTEAVGRELRQNAENAERRAAAITRELQRLGGVADVVTPLVGRLAAVVKATFEQAEPVDEAILGDLLLEHQLQDRATYLKALAEAAHDPSVRALADRLIAAHRATVEWLTTVLAEHALGGPPALRATPVQAVTGGVARAVNYPVRFARDQVNRALGGVRRTGEQVRTGVTEVAGKAAQFSENARDVLVTGRDASLERAEHVARAEGDAATARAVHEVRTGLGGLEPAELPIADYETLGAAEVVQAVKQLGTVDELNRVLHYEEAHKNRSSVVSAAQTRHAALAREVVGLR